MLFCRINIRNIAETNIVKEVLLPQKQPFQWTKPDLIYGSSLLGLLTLLDCYCALIPSG